MFDAVTYAAAVNKAKATILPAGGGEGQVLGKDADGNTTWVDNAIAENAIVTSETQPESPATKIWIDEGAEEIEILTMEDVPWLSESISEITTEGYNIFNTYFVKGSITSSGVIRRDESATSVITNDYITITQNAQFIFNFLGEHGAIYGCAYDADKKFISRLSRASGNVYTFPENAYYYMFFIQNATPDGITNFQLEYGDELHEYTPYGRYLNPNKLKDLTGTIVETINPRMETLLANITDKAEGIEWVDGKRISWTNPSVIVDDGDYRIGAFSVSKGDLIIIDYNSAQGDYYVVLSEKLYQGYKPLVNRANKLHWEYVCERDMDVVVCIRPRYFTDIHWYSAKAYAKDVETSQDKYIRFPYNEINTKLVGMTTAPMQGATIKDKPTTFVHFSDIHNSIMNVQNIGEFLEKYGSYIDDTIMTGDMCASRFTDYIPIYAEDDYKKILLCIGNHDVYDHNGDAENHGVSYDDKAYWATPQEKYNQYIKPNVSDWGVIQPNNAETNGLCYYYKDYGKVRLVVLDAMAYDSAQHTWLSNVLNDAKTNSLHVVIAEHFPPTETSDGDYTLFETGFSSLMTGMEMWYGLSYVGYNDGTRHTATNLVDEFISAGGMFVCWLCGHLHYGQVGTLDSHPNQIFIAVETANRSAVWKDVPREWNDKSEDLFNVVSIDTVNQIIKVCRIGAEWDDHMRHRGAMCIDYANRKLISTY